LNTWKRRAAQTGYIQHIAEDRDASAERLG
jgi:hypothetical protein